MKKTKKAIASLVIAGMALTMVPFNAFATGTVSTRLAGITAAQTAVEIANQTGWTGTAILASSASYGMVDALTAGPLASYLEAPILLTGAGNVLDADTKAELVKLAVTKVYVTSGTAVISQAVLTELAAMSITVIPLGGFDRAATSVNIASKMVGVTKVAVANARGKPFRPVGLPPGSYPHTIQTQFNRTMELVKREPIRLRAVGSLLVSDNLTENNILKRVWKGKVSA